MIVAVIMLIAWTPAVIWVVSEIHSHYKPKKRTYETTSDWSCAAR